MLRFLLIMTLVFGPSSVSADGIIWNVVPDFKGYDSALEISGAVCPGKSKTSKVCYAVNDEDNRIQMFEINERTIIPGKRIRLLPRLDANGKKVSEADLEAVAHYDGYLYVTGSHGLSRKKGKFRPSQFRVFRFPVNPDTGEPRISVSGKTVSPGIEKTAKLRDMIKQTGELAPYAEQHLSENGANIEGMSIHDGSVFFGFRAPVEAKGALVLEVSINGLFANGTEKPVAHQLQLGTGYGIRDMAPIRNGFVILAGATGKKDLVPTIWRWSPGKHPKLLKVLRVQENSKAEAITLLKEKKSGKVRALIFFDGRKNGAPQEFKFSLN